MIQDLRIKKLNIKKNRFLNPASCTLNLQRGFSLLEIVVGVAIISLALFGISATARNMVRVSADVALETQSGFLLEEGIEAMRAVRDNSWASIGDLSVGEEYYIDTEVALITGWLSQTPSRIDDTFTRTVVIDDVFRDATDDIVELGTLDPNTKMVSVEITWSKANGLEVRRSASTLLTNLFE